MKTELIKSASRFVAVLAFILMGLLIFAPNMAEAGIYSENSETTYQELWIPHSEFTGHCGESGNKWFIEPDGCDKELDFNLPNVNNITKIELYIDLWRNRDAQSARFSINGGSTIKPNVGSDWSRTPYIHEFTGSELSDFETGINTIRFWDEAGAYHVHDIALRVFSNASDVATTDGNLHMIQANGTLFNPYVGGTQNLNVDSDQLLISADVQGDAAYVEFHAFYDGYDEDNDGIFRDWHNLNNNNWNPGGSNNAPGVDNPNPLLGGTINHIGTVQVTEPGIYTATWSLPHIINQNGIRFKVRIVDDNGFVRDAAGGDSKNFNLTRTNSTAYFTNPNFEDMVIHHDGDEGFSDEVFTTVMLPDDLSAYDSAYLIGAYYANLYISINGEPRIRAFEPPAIHTGRWDLSIINEASANGSTRDIMDDLQPGLNTITYSYWDAANQWGSFIEHPGPMLVLKREDSSGGSDVIPPDLYNEMPEDGSAFVETDTAVSFYLIDPGSGVNNGSIEMRVDGALVNPTINNTPSGTLVEYTPATDFDPDTDVVITVDACDNQGNCIDDETFTFRTASNITGVTAESDDFSYCDLGNSSVNWSFVDPKSDSTMSMGETFDRIQISVPAGSAHDPVVNNTSARLMQPAQNANEFVITTKFTTIPTERFQLQGMLVEQDANDYIRFDLYHDGADLRGFVAIIDGEAATPFTTIVNKPVPSATRYLLINRVGSLWRMHHSIDGLNWKVFVEFNHNLVVSSTGLYAGNAGTGGDQSLAPAYTAEFDYFLDWGDPFPTDEDEAALYLPISVNGEGSVTKSNACGQPVTLTAVPADGYTFERWSGAVSGTNPTITVNSWNNNDSVTAHFKLDTFYIHLPYVNR